MHNPTGFSFSRNFSTILSLQTKAGIKALLSACSCPIIMDEQVCKFHSDLVSLPFAPRLLLLPAGESSKTPETVKLIYDFLAECKAGRSTDVFVIGGGTVTDTAAFAVSTFKRGCRLTLIPSTLLGMIDAALGGKTAVNFPSFKNLIGSFYPAAQVIISPDFLLTLPDTELKNGLAEMLKLKLILPALSEPRFASSGYPEADQIMEYAHAKLHICASDLDDTGSRRLLNLGHTFGHALESYSNYAISHGEAVVWGIATAAKISEKFGKLKSCVCHQIIQKLKSHGFKTELEAAIKNGFNAAFPTLVAHDKKSASDLLTLILFEDNAKPVIIDNIALQSITAILPDCI
jgi:3-dehydroquinate synthase